MKTSRSALLTLSLAVVSFGGLACQGALTEEESLVGEATAYLTAGEETGDLGNEAAAAASDEELSAEADGSAILPEPSGEGGGCELAPRRARVIARYDADGNGQLDPSERQALKGDLEARVGHPLAVRFGLTHRVHVLGRLRWAFDENADGALSSDERTAMHDALEARCQRVRAALLARFDANGNGTLDDGEKAAARAAFLARLRAIRQDLLTRYDLNHNGALDPAERQQLKADRLAALQARRAALLARFDANGDGSLDGSERLALKHAIQQRVSDGRDAE